ncbi:MAG: hypothetical protein OEU36_16730 [Gammaproteobacteria bacterium]|nr:hypothetical protein [Gammaproteobacteria bacterium]
MAEGLGIGLLIPFLFSLTQGTHADGGLVMRWVDGYAVQFAADLRLILVATIALLVIVSCAINFAYLRVLSWSTTQVTHDLRAPLLERFVRLSDARRRARDAALWWRAAAHCTGAGLVAATGHPDPR